MPGVEGPTRDIPEEWKDFHPPSLAAGHWMSFGPTEAVLTVADRPQTASSYGNAKKELEHGKSSLWKGTIWLTEVSISIHALLRALTSSDAWPQCPCADQLDIHSQQKFNTRKSRLTRTWLTHRALGGFYTAYAWAWT